MGDRKKSIAIQLEKESKKPFWLNRNANWLNFNGSRLRVFSCLLLHICLTNPSSFSLSSYIRCSSPLIIFIPLCCICSSMSMYFWSWGDKNWTQFPSCGFTSTELRGKITSLSLLEKIFLIQPKRLSVLFAAEAHCGSWSTCCPQGPSGPFLPNCFPASYSSLDEEFFISPCWYSWVSSLPISLACQDPSECCLNYVVYELLPLILYHPQTCWGCTLSHHPGR